MIDFIEDVITNGIKYEAVIWNKAHSASLTQNGTTKARALASLLLDINKWSRASMYDWNTLRFYRRIPSCMNSRKGVIAGHFTGETALLERRVPTGGWDLH